MKECDNSIRKIHISSNFILPISLLIMFDNLLLRPSLAEMSKTGGPLFFHPRQLYVCFLLNKCRTHTPHTTNTHTNFSPSTSVLRGVRVVMKRTCYFCHVRPFIRMCQQGSYQTDFREIWYVEPSMKTCQKSKFDQNWVKISDNFRKYLSRFYCRR
jgi:hypothetical protein